jgi:uncharacterized protein YdhG (YjbR/CyaY superfamily)
MKRTQSSAKSAGTVAEQHDGFTAEERDAMKERAKELKADHRSARGQGGHGERGAGEDRRDAGSSPSGSTTSSRPPLRDLTPKLWYGMPAYAKNGKVLCHFQSAQKFKSRYATLGFSDQAALDAMWPTAYALEELTAADEKRISALIKKL